MKKEILALTLSVAMLITGGLTSVTAAEFEDTSICADEVSSDVNEAFDKPASLSGIFRNILSVFFHVHSGCGFLKAVQSKHSL